MRKIRFYTNKGFDKFMTSQFIDMKAAGVNFGQGIIKKHPNLKNAKQANDPAEREIIVSKYFDKFYVDEKDKILRKKYIFRQEWRKRESRFFKLCNELFYGFEPNPGMYICYLSIMDCNPRFLESKIFQVYFGKDINDAMHTIAHEILHFIFFDFINAKFMDQKKELSEDALWDLSEIFNVVILSSKLFSEIISRDVIKAYPDHQNDLPIFFDTYEHSKGVEDFIKKGLEIIKKKKS